MSRPPLPPLHDRLDAQERALAALLPRALGRGEPDPQLDARILAAARTAAPPQPALPRQRRRWIGPTAVAASLMLAVGLAWQLRPPPAPDFPAQAADAAPAESDATAVLAIEPPPPPRNAPPAALPKPTVQARQVPAMPPAPVARADKPVAAPAAPANTEVAAAPPPPPAPPAPPAAGVVDAATPQNAQAARAPAMTKAGAGEAVRERSLASGNAAVQAQDATERAAADAAARDSVGTDDPGEDVPPATADSPEVRDAWLRRIGELLRQGKTDEARASLAEFKRRYPDTTLPPELRKLEP